MMTPVPIRALLVEDDPVAAAFLRTHLASFPDVQLVAHAFRAEEALPLLLKHEPNLLLLDVELPGLNAFELLDTMRMPMPVVLTTAHTHYAARAFNHKVLDFLVKPIEPARLADALHRVRQFMNSRPATPLQHVFLRKGREWLRFSTSDVLYLESVKNELVVHTRTAKGVSATPVDSGLKEIEAAVQGSPLLRTHRSYIVNLDHVQRYDGNSLRMAGVTQTLPIGRAHLARVRSRLNLAE